MLLKHTLTVSPVTAFGLPNGSYHWKNTYNTPSSCSSCITPVYACIGDACLCISPTLCGVPSEFAMLRLLFWKCRSVQCRPSTRQTCDGHGAKWLPWLKPHMTMIVSAHAISAFGCREVMSAAVYAWRLSISLNGLRMGSSFQSGYRCLITFNITQLCTAWTQ